MHCKDLVVQVSREQLVARNRQLQADEECLNASHEQEEERGNAVHDADLLMVHGVYPRPPTGVCLGTGKHTKGTWRLGRNRVVSGGQFKRTLIFDDRHQINLSFGSAEYSYVHHFVHVFLLNRSGLLEGEVHLRVRR